MAENETIRNTIVLNDNSIETEKIVQLGIVYPLTEVNFYKIKNGASGFKDWAKRLLFISIGWSIKVLSVVIIFLTLYSSTEKTNTELKLDVEAWELVSIGIALVLCGITYLCGTKFKNDRDKTMTQIDDFFKKK